MEVILKQENNEPISAEEARRQLIEQGMIDGEYIFIDKFLREDKTIYLEVLELAINVMVILDLVDKIVVRNLWEYFVERGIQDNVPQREEEHKFIYMLCRAMSQEANNGKEIQVVFGN